MAKNTNTNEGTDSLSPEAAKKAAKKERGKEKRANKKAALSAVLAFVLDNATDDALIAQANSLKPGRAVVTGAGSAIADYMVENVEADEDTIWAEFKLGRAEMRKISVNLIKKAKSPEDRLWVAFAPENGTYTLVDTGADVPSGWTGYRPVDVEDVQID